MFEENKRLREALAEIRRYVDLWAKPGTTAAHIAHICDGAIASAEGGAAD